MTPETLQKDLIRGIYEINNALKLNNLSIKTMDELRYKSSTLKEDLNHVNLLLATKHNSLAFIGETMGVSRERVRQIEQGALKKLKHPSVGRKLRPFLTHQVVERMYVES